MCLLRAWGHVVDHRMHSSLCADIKRLFSIRFNGNTIPAPVGEYEAGGATVSNMPNFKID